ncbi:MAG: hypothetical protein CMJ49_03935 [Planctomycetaceae bacterium]|nr:hypothetical protein [Planctomycetaceae bacterium]
MAQVPAQARRIELILQQIESLPTLPGIAMRLLQLTTDDDSDTNQVVELIRSDQALSVKVLALCRAADFGVRGNEVDIDRAVVMLGFDAVRNAVLSIKVMESFAEAEVDAAPDDGAARFDRPAFWRHCLAVAIAAELIAARHSHLRDLKPADAFMCGLLHDLGKLALDYALPRSYLRVIELTEKTHGNIAEIERDVLDLDHHTAGKRLAERWQLPHVIQDAMWLHGVPFESLPDLPHRRLIGLIGLADLLVRRQHIGYSGNHDLDESLIERATALGLDADEVESVVAETHEELRRRSEAMGLSDQPTTRLMLESIMQANSVLGRLNQDLQHKRQLAGSQSQALDVIGRFHRRASEPGRSVQDVLAEAVRSAGEVFGPGFYAIIHQPTDDPNWVVSRYHHSGRLINSRMMEPPPHSPSLAQLIDADQLSVDTMGVLPWLHDVLADHNDIRRIRLLPITEAWGTASVMLHDRTALPKPRLLAALTRSWGAAIAAAAKHEGARRLGERLAETNRIVAQSQQTLTRSKSLARLGEMASGAAHEMNNPLAVISGRAQLLAATLEQGSKARESAELIFEQSQRLSDLISALRLFAEPPKPNIQDVNVTAVIERAVHFVQQRAPDAPAIRVSVSPAMPPLHADAEQLASALGEVVLNAVQSGGTSPVELSIHVDPLKGRWNFNVKDDGVGMDARTLEHAFDPFFSAQPAGRQPGLGLARARRLVECMGGDIELRSTQGQGSTAIVTMPFIGADTLGQGPIRIRSGSDQEEKGEERAARSQSIR